MVRVHTPNYTCPSNEHYQLKNHYYGFVCGMLIISILISTDCAGGVYTIDTNTLHTVCKWKRQLEDSKKEGIFYTRFGD